MRSSYFFKLVTIMLMSVVLAAWVGCEDDHKVVPPYYNPVLGPEDNPEEEPGEQPGENPGEDPGEEPGEDPGEEPGEEPSEEPGEPPVLLEFGFKSQYNASYLSSDIACVINEDLSVSYDSAIKTLKPMYAGGTLKPTFKTNEGNKVYSGDKEQYSGMSAQDFTKPVTYKVVNNAGESIEYTVSLDFTFTGLPIVVVSTENGAAITSKHTWVKATFSFMGGEEFDDIETMDIEIAGRGNSTWLYQDKKPYKMKFSKKTSVMGIPKHKRWVLLANALDKTMLRNDVAFRLGQKTSVAWTPRGYHVELVLNGQHKGTYFLCEQIKVDEERVNITEMPAASELTPDDDITGGYLMEMDTYTPDDDETLFYSKYGYQNGKINVKIKTPEAEDLSESQLEYITNYFHAFEDAVRSEDWLDEEKGYKNYIDVNSFVDLYLVSELIGHTEWQHPKSTYIYKDGNGGKLTFGPMWDYDWTTFTQSSGWICKKALWYPYFFNDPEFVALVKSRWTDLYPEFQAEIAYMQSMKSKLAESVEKNFKIWDPSMPNAPNGESDLTFEQSVDRMITKYRDRLNWLNNQIKALK